MPKDVVITFTWGGGIVPKVGERGVLDLGGWSREKMNYTVFWYLYLQQFNIYITLRKGKVHIILVYFLENLSTSFLYNT